MLNRRYHEKAHIFKNFSRECLNPVHRDRVKFGILMPLRELLLDVSFVKQADGIAIRKGLPSERMQ